MSYCQYIQKETNRERKTLHKMYHDIQYGFPLHDDTELFARLIFEINQAGLSWDIILKKEKNFRDAYKNFNIEKVAQFDQKDIDRLLDDKGIIRNRLKIESAIHNAKIILKIQKEYDSFEKWLFIHKDLNLKEWVKLFKVHFKFTGEEIVKEFLMSIGYLEGAHDINCPIYKKITKQKPIWLSK